MSSRIAALWACALALLLVGLTLVSVAVGSAEIVPRDVWASILAGLGLSTQVAPPPALQSIVLDLRLPRALLALVVGAGLALVGVLLQTVTRNDLTDPFLFGLSSGAAAGAVAVIVVIGDLLERRTLPAAAFAGGMLAAASVLVLTRSGTLGQSADSARRAGDVDRLRWCAPACAGRAAGRR